MKKRSKTKKSKFKIKLFPDLQSRQRVNALLRTLGLPFRFTVLHWRLTIISLLVILGIFSYLTNPFVKFSIVLDPYKTARFENEKYVLDSAEPLLVQEDPFFKRLAMLKSGWHIVTGKFAGGKKAENKSVDEIILEIHKSRFDPEEPYLISGDHFSVFYPRSLGMFYHMLLDPRIALDDDDWHRKQLIYLKTTAYALNVFAESDRLSTTVVPVGPRSVVLVNIYAPPSDTLHSILYALETLKSTKEHEIYPFEVENDYQLTTEDAAEDLLSTFDDDLQRHFDKYQRDVYDFNTGFIKDDILISSTKDGTKRYNAFYDNVIFWKTHQLAQRLEIIDKDEKFLEEYKKRILEKFWIEEEGFFVEDATQEAKDGKWYSSDWLIAYQVGFLDPENSKDREYLIKSIDYIQRNAIDQPFALQFQAEPHPHRLYLPVRLTAGSYSSTGIWSYLGMDYIRLLSHLAQVTGDEEYLETAEKNLQAYSYNIKRYRGYPEVYDDKGDFFKTTFYKSIRTTGWVVSFEQAKTMHDWTRENWDSFAK